MGHPDGRQVGAPGQGWEADTRGQSCPSGQSPDVHTEVSRPHSAPTHAARPVDQKGAPNPAHLLGESQDSARVGVLGLRVSPTCAWGSPNGNPGWETFLTAASIEDGAGLGVGTTSLPSPLQPSWLGHPDQSPALDLTLGLPRRRPEKWAPFFSRSSAQLPPRFFLEAWTGATPAEREAQPGLPGA